MNLQDQLKKRQITSGGHALSILMVLFFAWSNFTLKTSQYLTLHHPQYCEPRS